jgi:hypothetical protein
VSCTPLDDFSIDSMPDLTVGQMLQRLQECNSTSEPADACAVVDFR